LNSASHVGHLLVVSLIVTCVVQIVVINCGFGS